MPNEIFDYQDYRNRSAQHIMFYEAGVSNRDKVFNARVALIGLGAITVEAARLLSIAHVGLLRFIHWGTEPDDASHAGLQRGAEAGEYLPRGIDAVQALEEANPSVAFEVVNAAEFTKSTNSLTAPAEDTAFDYLFHDIDLILYEDSDSRLCQSVSEAARRLKKTWIYAEARGGSGMTVSIIPGQTACIGCVKNEMEAEDSRLNYAATVTDLIARTISQVQAMEALKILGESPNLSREIYCFDVNKFGHTLTVAKDDACPSCNG